MWATILQTGLDIKLTKEDITKKELECVINGYENIKVYLHIVDEIKEQHPREVLGFHMQCYPKHTELRKSEKVHIYLKEEIWKDLITKYDHEAGGGYFESRCGYDWFSIRYVMTKV